MVVKLSGEGTKFCIVGKVIGSRGVPTRIPHESIRLRLWELQFFDSSIFDSIIGATILRLL